MDLFVGLIGILLPVLFVYYGIKLVKALIDYLNRH